ncbi:hypothetical protein [Actinokineospora sp.]|uniref:hypothetical protein n=1 Tax=Actinokineospora sp. TaxID=1872133 RepID=UPI00403767FB
MTDERVTHLCTWWPHDRGARSTGPRADMEAHEVEQLARRESARWTPAPGFAYTVFPPFQRPVPIDVVPPGGTWHAYVPLDSAEPVSLAPDPFRFLDATAVGTILVFRFTWLDRPDPPDYLLHLDMSEVPPGSFDGASVFLLETVAELTAFADWPERRTVALSSRVSLVLPRTAL